MSKGWSWSTVSNFSEFSAVSVLDWFPLELCQCKGSSGCISPTPGETQIERGQKKMRCTVISRVSPFLSLSSLRRFVLLLFGCHIQRETALAGVWKLGAGETLTCFILSTSFTQSLTFVFYFSPGGLEISAHCLDAVQKREKKLLRNLWVRFTLVIWSIRVILEMISDIRLDLWQKCFQNECKCHHNSKTASYAHIIQL